jgi:hypothetical protein
VNGESAGGHDFFFLFSSSNDINILKDTHCVTKARDLPAFPARAVRPTLWMYSLPYKKKRKKKKHFILVDM